jgi:hypothetical protein
VRRGLVVEEIGEHPLHRDAALLGKPGRLVQPHWREVDARDLPAALRQPDGVASFTARDIQRRAGGKIFNLRGQEPIRLGRPNQLVAAIAAIPSRAVHRHILAAVGRGPRRRGDRIATIDASGSVRGVTAEPPAA